MSARTYKLIFGLLIGLAVSLTTGWARDHGKGHWERGRAYSFWSFSPPIGNRPPGWDRGRKTGWGYCDLPPGLAKKEGCSPIFFGGGRNRRHGAVIVISLP